MDSVIQNINNLYPHLRPRIERNEGMKDKNNSILPIEEYRKPDSGLDDIRDYNNPLILVNVESFDQLLGKLFTNFELLGLPERQGKALTGSVRRMAWEWFDRHLPNPHGYASPSMQARQTRGIEPSTTSASANFYYKVSADK